MSILDLLCLQEPRSYWTESWAGSSKAARFIPRRVGRTQVSSPPGTVAYGVSSLMRVDQLASAVRPPGP
jgi:hypothetical protein